MKCRWLFFVLFLFVACDPDDEFQEFFQEVEGTYVGASVSHNPAISSFTPTMFVDSTYILENGNAREFTVSEMSLEQVTITADKLSSIYLGDENTLDSDTLRYRLDSSALVTGQQIVFLKSSKTAWTSESAAAPIGVSISTGFYRQIE